MRLPDSACIRPKLLVSAVSFSTGNVKAPISKESTAICFLSWRNCRTASLPQACAEASGVRPNVVTQEHGTALVAQQVGGHQGGGDPASLVEPGAAHAKAADEGLLGPGCNGEKRDEAEHSTSFQGVEAHRGPAQVGRGRRVPISC